MFWQVSQKKTQLLSCIALTITKSTSCAAVVARVQPPRSSGIGYGGGSIALVLLVVGGGGGGGRQCATGTRADGRPGRYAQSSRHLGGRGQQPLPAAKTPPPPPQVATPARRTPQLSAFSVSVQCAHTQTRPLTYSCCRNTQSHCYTHHAPEPKKTSTLHHTQYTLIWTRCDTCQLHVLCFGYEGRLIWRVSFLEIDSCCWCLCYYWPITWKCSIEKFLILNTNWISVCALLFYSVVWVTVSFDFCDWLKNVCVEESK